MSSETPHNSRYLNIAVGDCSLLLSYLECVFKHPVLSLRQKEIRLAIKRAIRRLGILEWDGDNLSVTIVLKDDVAPRDVNEALRKLDVRVNTINRRPVGGRFVEEVLQISSKQRRRWSKDGHLPTAGSESIRNVSMFLYSAVDILLLAEDMTTIRRWRVEDTRADMPVEKNE